MSIWSILFTLFFASCAMSTVSSDAGMEASSDCDTEGAFCCGTYFPRCKKNLVCEKQVCTRPPSCDSQGAKCCSFIGITYCKGNFYCYQAEDGSEWCNDPGYK